MHHAGCWWCFSHWARHQQSITTTLWSVPGLVDYRSATSLNEQGEITSSWSEASRQVRGDVHTLWAMKTCQYNYRVFDRFINNSCTTGDRNEYSTEELRNVHLRPNCASTPSHKPKNNRQTADRFLQCVLSKIRSFHGKSFNVPLF